MIVVVFPLLAPWALITHVWRVAAACDWLQCMLGNRGEPGPGALFCTIFRIVLYSGADSNFRGFFTARNQPECRILLESSALWELCDTGERSRSVPTGGMRAPSNYSGALKLLGRGFFHI